MANSSAAGRTFFKDLVALQAALRNPAFDKENTAFKQNGKVYRYASLAAHLDAVRPVITKHGFAITQLIQGRDGNLEVTTQLVHESGEVMGATIAVPLPTGGAHGIMGMITYLRRGQMASLLGIVGDDDNDGNEVAEPKAQQGARMPQEAPAAPKRLPAPSKPAKAAGGKQEAFQELRGVLTGVQEKVSKAGKTYWRIGLEAGEGQEWFTSFQPVSIANGEKVVVVLEPYGDGVKVRDCYVDPASEEVPF